MLTAMTDTSRARAVNMGVKLGKLALRNPIVTVSGTCGYGDEYGPFMDLHSASVRGSPLEKMYVCSWVK